MFSKLCRCTNVPAAGLCIQVKLMFHETMLAIETLGENLFSILIQELRHNHSSVLF